MRKIDEAVARKLALRYRDDLAADLKLKASDIGDILKSCIHGETRNGPWFHFKLKRGDHYIYVTQIDSQRVRCVRSGMDPTAAKVYTF